MSALQPWLPVIEVALTVVGGIVVAVISNRKPFPPPTSPTVTVNTHNHFHLRFKVKVPIATRPRKVQADDKPSE